MLKIFLSSVFYFFVSYAHAQGTLIFAIDLVRHGDRTPMITSPGMEKIWSQGVGQLTPTGMSQEYTLGKVLHKTYVKKYHLLPKQYNVNSMTVRSSGMPRTMMSAQSLLLGLYPLGTGPSVDSTTKALPKGFQPIPINMVPREQDSLLLPNYDKARYNQLLETYIFNTQEWIQKDQALKPYYSAWSKAADISISSLFDLIHLGDRFMIERLYNIPLPDGLQEQDADRIIDAGKWASLYIANNSKLAELVGTELAQTIKHEIMLATEQNRPLKYLLFVAHDTTIEAQLKILGQTIDDLPPYAASVNYSVFDMGSSHYEVRVAYNQKPLFIEQCGGTVCTLSDFINLIA